MMESNKSTCYSALLFQFNICVCLWCGHVIVHQSHCIDLRIDFVSFSAPETPSSPAAERSTATPPGQAPPTSTLPRTPRRPPPITRHLTESRGKLLPHLCPLAHREVWEVRDHNHSSACHWSWAEFIIHNYSSDLVFSSNDISVCWSQVNKKLYIY